MKRYLEKVVFCKDGGLRKDILAESEAATLYITDNEACLWELKRKGLPAAAWLHEGNRDQKLSGASYAVEKPEELDMEFYEKIYRREKGIPWEILETERCLVREMIPEDGEAFARMYQEPGICRYMKDFHGEATGNAQGTADDERRYIEEYQQQYRFFEYGVWSVVLKETGEVIGRVGFSEPEASGGAGMTRKPEVSGGADIVQESCSHKKKMVYEYTFRNGSDPREGCVIWGEEDVYLPQFGYMIGVPWQRQGLAYEVCRAALEYAREELGFERILLVVEESNRASRHLAEKLGFRRIEGDKLVQLVQTGTKYKYNA